ncbi:MAG: carotenoid oxygenase family protein [Rhodospirillaceae bacterium]|nr:carotenoid oxygenase family protein [Rhodospirillaceae bacterium]
MTDTFRDRRSFLAASAVASLAGMAPFAQSLAATDTDWGTEFSRALKKNPLLIGWKTPPDRLDTMSLETSGAWPADLEGRFYRNGPAAHDRFGRRYQHWFDADGMIQEFVIDSGRVAHRGRLVQTPKLKAENKAGRRLYGGFGTHWPNLAPFRGPDSINVANISVLHHGGELMALWEAGSPTLLDQRTLEARRFKSWGDSLKGLAFSAHPKVDLDGTLWNFGYNLLPRPALVLYHIDHAGKLVKTAIVKLDALGMVHDFVVTEKSLVIVIPPYHLDPTKARSNSFLDAHVWKPGDETRVLVVSKDDFSKRRWHGLPAGFGFHHGNGWEENDGVIHFDHCIAKDPTIVSETLRFVMKGELRTASPAYYSQIVLRPKGDATVSGQAEEAEFPQISPVVVGKRNRYVYMLGVETNGSGWGFRKILKRDLEKGKSDVFSYPIGITPEEHLFVPRRSGRREDDGWLIGTVLDWKKGRSGISVFDATAVAAGPIAQAWLPYPIPLGFHGTFVPA